MYKQPFPSNISIASRKTEKGFFPPLPQKNKIKPKAAGMT